MEPLVSVVIPVYNAEAYLNQCLESIISQTYSNLEIICVDNGSSDQSNAIIEGYRRQDKRVLVLKQSYGFAGGARNCGMDRAKGKYVLFLDADDFFEADMIEKMLCRAEEAQADIVLCGSRGYDNERKSFHQLNGGFDSEQGLSKKVFSKNDVPDMIFQLTAGWPWDKLYRLDFLRGKKIYFQEIRVANDAFFVNIAFAEAERIAAVGEYLAVHRTNVASSLESTRSKWWMCGYEMLYATKSGLEKRRLFKSVEKSFANMAAGYIVWNACTITEPTAFGDFYEYSKRQGIESLGLLEYPADYFFDSFAGKAVSQIVSLEQKDFLLWRISDLNNVLKERDNLITEQNNIIRKKVWCFPEERFQKNEKIIIYGYGDVGKDFCRQTEKSAKVRLVGAADKNYEKYKNAPVSVFDVSAVRNMEFDYVIIANRKEAVAAEMRLALLANGISDNRIIWFNVME